MGKIKGIIFDKDGTLFDYAEVWGGIIYEGLLEALNQTKLSKEKIDDCASELEVVFGVDHRGNKYPKGILFRHDKMIRAFFRLLHISLKYHIPPKTMYHALTDSINTANNHMEEKLKGIEFPYVAEVFRKCRDYGMIIGMVTNDTAARTSIFMDKMGIKDYVSFLRTKDSGTKHKPNPQAIDEFCEQFQLKASEVAVVGDTLIDIRFAQKGKVGYSVAVLTGSGDILGLAKKADAIYEKLPDIQKDRILFPDQKNS